MRAFGVLLMGCFVACGPAASRPEPMTPTADPAPGVLAEDTLYKPPYAKADLEKALIAERGKEATDEKNIAEVESKETYDDQLRFMQADLAVRRRFIASLETCQDSGRACPPRLDDPPWAYDPDPDRPTPPPLDSPLRFDLESWKRIAIELHGRACACRTQSCVDSMQVVIDDLETRPMKDVQGDDEATQEVAWARECLFHLRGKVALPKPLDLTE